MRKSYPKDLMSSEQRSGIDFRVHFHKIQLLKSQRRGLIKLNLSPAILVQEVFKDSIAEGNARK